MRQPPEIRTCLRGNTVLDRGEGRLGFIVTLVVVLSICFVGFKVVPVRINAYQFRDTLREEARYAAVNRYSDHEIKRRVLESARSLNIPLDPGQVSISRSQREVVISARFEQPIDLKLATYTYRFRDQQRAPVF